MYFHPEPLFWDLLAREISDHIGRKSCLKCDYSAVGSALESALEN